MKNNFFSSLLLIISILIIMSGCVSTDRVVFVTATEIGIGADAKIGNVNIGYDRNELVIGPVYPDQGAVPPVYARIETNLKVFNPEIKQLYATGEAANIVTGTPTPKYDAGKLFGKRRLMVFGTSTNLGLKVHFSGQAPDSFNFGYKRKEFSVIPLRKKKPTKKDPDKYASVIASIGMTSSATSLPGTGIKLSQFIATGTAAENVAEQNKGIFQSESENALEQAGIAEGVRYLGKIDLIANHVNVNDELDRSKLTQLFESTEGLKNHGNREHVEDAINLTNLKNRLEQTDELVTLLYEALP